MVVGTAPGTPGLDLHGKHPDAVVRRPGAPLGIRPDGDLHRQPRRRASPEKLENIADQVAHVELATARKARRDVIEHRVDIPGPSHDKDRAMSVAKSVQRQPRRATYQDVLDAPAHQVPRPRPLLQAGQEAA